MPSKRALHPGPREVDRRLLCVLRTRAFPKGLEAGRASPPGDGFLSIYAVSLICSLTCGARRDRVAGGASETAKTETEVNPTRWVVEGAQMRLGTAIAEGRAAPRVFIW